MKVSKLYSSPKNDVVLNYTTYYLTLATHTLSTATPVLRNYAVILPTGTTGTTVTLKTMTHCGTPVGSVCTSGDADSYGKLWYSSRQCLYFRWRWQLRHTVRLQSAVPVLPGMLTATAHWCFNCQYLDWWRYNYGTLWYFNWHNVVLQTEVSLLLVTMTATAHCRSIAVNHNASVSLAGKVRLMYRCPDTCRNPRPRPALNSWTNNKSLGGVIAGYLARLLAG